MYAIHPDLSLKLHHQRRTEIENGARTTRTTRPRRLRRSKPARIPV
jgi:hypothetical protein